MNKAFSDEDLRFLVRLLDLFQECSFISNFFKLTLLEKKKKEEIEAEKLEKLDKTEKAEKPEKGEKGDKGEKDKSAAKKPSELDTLISQIEKNFGKGTLMKVINVKRLSNVAGRFCRNRKCTSYFYRVVGT